MTIDLESLREVRDYFADRQDAEQLAGESFPTPNEEMRLLVTVDSVLTELTARRARDAEAVRRQDMTTNDKLADALRNLIRAGKHLRNTVVETRGVAGMDDHDVAISDSIAALAEHDAQPAPAPVQVDKRESEMSESRFYIEHGVVHDRKTGKHLVGCYYTDEDPDRLLSVLRELETDYDAWRMPAAPAADGAGELPPIERDEAYERDYIPLPGGWGIQTKGKGSTFRVCDTKTGERAAIPDERLHPFIERMAREVRAAIAALRQPVPDAVREEVVGAIAKPATGWDVAGNYGDGKWRAFRLEKQQTYLGDPKSSEMEAIAETHRLAALASQQESRNAD